MEAKVVAPKLEDQATVGVSHIPCLITDEMRAIMRSNSLALEEMMVATREGLPIKLAIAVC